MKLLCTPQLIRKIAGKVRRGASIKRACPACGVRWDTAHKWLTKGRNAELDEAGKPVRAEDRIFVTFLETMERAKAEWAESAERLVYSASQHGTEHRGDWKAAAYLLERRYGSEYRLAPVPRLEGNVGNTDPGGSQAPSDEGATVTILVYPVPMPRGADPRSMVLPAGHALEHTAIDEEKTRSPG